MMENTKSDNRIMIVDDSAVNVEILQHLLRDDYQLAVALSGEECLATMQEFAPDLILLDIMMPGIDGYEVCRRIKSSPVGPFTQIILVSGKAMKDDRLKGFEAGADDYITKPFDHDELLARLRIHFRLRTTTTALWTANSRLQDFNGELERLVQDRTAEISATRDVAVFALAKLAESRDPETGEHLDRMSNYSRILAEQLCREGPYTGQLTPQTVDDIIRSSPLHDIGKVGIPDAVLLKPGRLTKSEFEVMKGHCEIGAQALEQAMQHGGCGGFLKTAVDVARYHHERFDGSGYPHGLAGQAIPLSARIVALADVYDALTSARVYKTAYDPETARRIIEEEDGLHFDPAVLAAFRARHDDFLKLSAARYGRNEELVATGESGEVRR
jgi:putative two-component system response regulator